MQLHQLRPKTRRKHIKRVGRGGKRGTYSGKGMKGQRSRAGRRIRPAERDLVQRLPKLRGFKFKTRKPKSIGINVGELDNRIKDNIINLKSLTEAGLIRRSDKSVKILGTGNLKRPLEVHNLMVSNSARKKIESAGGRIIP